jgi:uncharacterized damage-inducible protein DinB
MYTSVSEFLKDWEYEVDGTKKVFANLTDTSLEQRVTPDGRSLGTLAWHITVTIPEMMHRAGLQVAGPEDNATRPGSVAPISEAYAQAAASLSGLLKEQWTDETLQESANMYGQDWKKGVVLSSLIFHQCHHRAQMTVLMRQACLTVPGLYGPSREEWETYGMTPQE